MSRPVLPTRLNRALRALAATTTITRDNHDFVHYIPGKTHDEVIAAWFEIVKEDE